MLTCPGMIVPPKNFFKKLRIVCNENDALLIIDEVGTGFGRTGKMFAIEHFGFSPDIMTFAKALSGGFAPIGATVTSRQIADSLYGKGGTSTYGWVPNACAASLKTIEVIMREKLPARAEKLGNYAVKRLQEELADVDIVGDIRGLGLELGIHLVKSRKTKEDHISACKAIVVRCREDGLEIIWSGRTSTVMIMPPLIIHKQQLDKGLEILIKNIKNYEDKS